MDIDAQIADEFNDNLDEWEKSNRDVRKELPKLLKTPNGVPSNNTYYEGQIYNVVARGNVGSGSS